MSTDDGSPVNVFDPLRQALDAHGYAVVPDVLAPHEIAEIRAAFERLVATARALPGTTDHLGGRFVLDAAPFRLHRVVWCGGPEPVLGRLGRHPAILDLAARALRSRDLVQLIQQAHFKLPGDEVAFPWHQDAAHRRQGTSAWTDVDGRGSFVEIVVAVDPMTADNGPLRMIPGSHRLGPLSTDAHGDLPAGSFDPSDAVDVILEPGAAAVFGPFVIHGSGPNRSRRSRRLFLNGFALPGANRRVYPGCGTGLPVTAPR